MPRTRGRLRLRLLLSVENEAGAWGFDDERGVDAEAEVEDDGSWKVQLAGIYAVGSMPWKERSCSPLYRSVEPASSCPAIGGSTSKLVQSNGLACLWSRVTPHPINSI